MIHIRTENESVKRKGTKGQIALHRKSKIEQLEPNKTGVNSGAPKDEQFLLHIMHP